MLDSGLQECTQYGKDAPASGWILLVRTNETTLGDWFISTVQSSAALLAVTAHTNRLALVFHFHLIPCIFLCHYGLYPSLVCAPKCFNELIAAIPISTCAVVTFRSIQPYTMQPNVDVCVCSHVAAYELCFKLLVHRHTHTGCPLSLSHHQMIDITFQFFWLDDDDDNATHRV